MRSRASDPWLPCRARRASERRDWSANPFRRRQDRGFEVFYTYCESHTREISFHVISRLLRALFAIGGLTAQDARARLRAAMPLADAENLLLLDELLGIRDTEMPLPDISPDARRRRLIELINTVSLARLESRLVRDRRRTLDRSRQRIDAYRIGGHHRPNAGDDADHVSPRVPGNPVRVLGARAIALAPLSDACIAELLSELLGTDSSVG